MSRREGNFLFVGCNCNRNPLKTAVKSANVTMLNVLRPYCREGKTHYIAKVLQSERFPVGSPSCRVNANHPEIHDASIPSTDSMPSGRKLAPNPCNSSPKSP